MKSTDYVLVAAGLLLVAVLVGRVIGQAGGKTMSVGVETAIEEIKRK